jgi:hypothetical protein
MNPELVGTWFLVRNKSDNALMITKAEKVIPSEWNSGSFQAEGSTCGWMCLSESSRRFYGELSHLTPEDFNALDLPEVTYENSPVEIEIMSSGNVYFY